MPGLDASAVASLLVEFGQGTALRVGNPYRARAYNRAAESLLALTEGVVQMLSVPGLRPEEVVKIHRELGVSSLAELERAAREDQLKSIKGLGFRAPA
jgi:DNA polymerase (family X)